MADKPADKLAQSLPTDHDDDFDELDDVLSQFTPGQKADTSSTSSPPPPPPPPTATTATTFRRPRTNTRVDAPLTSIPNSTNLDTTDEGEEELDFGRELAKGMENLMRELSAIEGMNGAGQNETTGSGFQDKIKQAVNKLKESESNLQVKAEGKSPNAPANAESFEALLSSLGDLGEGGDDKELAGLLENMMGELMSKSILYEPLSELAQTFPPYLEKPPNPLSDDDRKRYNLQLDCVRRILAVFDQPGYDDKNTESQQRIADLMAEMQNYGSPPSELMGPLPDLNDEGCTIT